MFNTNCSLVQQNTVETLAVLVCACIVRPSVIYTFGLTLRRSTVILVGS